MNGNRIFTQQGFSMIEVLIAVLVLAIGLLGVAALQLASMGSGQESYFRTQATALAEDYAARIKSGRQNIMKMRDGAGALIWDGAGPLAATQAYLDSFVGETIACEEEEAAQSCVGLANVCTAAQMAAYERWNVCRQARTLLPGGSLHAERNGLRLSIAVAWDATEARDDTGEQAPQVNPLCAIFNLDANKDCVVLEAIP